MSSTKIENVTVLGAGVLGAQIAFQSAYAGFNVVSYDINEDALAAARGRFDSLASSYVRDLEDADESTVGAARERLSQTADLDEAVSKADLVIEAVPEKFELKRDVWSKVGKAAPEHTIFATNTSTLLPSDIADASGREDHFLALHFTNHIWTRPTAEAMPTPKTDPEIFATALQYTKDMGLDPVEMKKEQPGYVVNGLLVPFLEAGQRLWADGVADYQDIDRAWRISMAASKGPFGIMDEIGLRTVHTISADHAESEGDELLGESARRIKEEFLDKGLVGLESGEGFFRYDEDGNIKY